MRIGIDATNIGGGGGVTHLEEILAYFNSNENTTIDRIIVFSSQKVLNKLINRAGVEKLSFPELNRGILSRMLFQLFKFDQEIKNRCDILFSLTGDYIGKFRPIVGMSQNMLLYERKIWKEIRQPKEILRFWIIFQKQRRSFYNSQGIIFISNYAKSYITKQLDLRGKQIAIIHHGISSRFFKDVPHQKPISDYSFSNPFKFIYVSTVHTYKNQWNVVEAIGQLREKGYPLELDLVGGVIFKNAGKKLEMTIQKIDPHNKFIHSHGHVFYEDIDKLYKYSDGIIFASTCENMPNILIESMASGLPIACSKKQPMPEFLKKNGFYFDAYNIDSIANAIEELLLNPTKRQEMAQNNLEEVKKYSWSKTADQTFKFIEQIYQEYYV